MIEVVGAILVQGQKILLAQRPAKGHQALLWEFPGGKIESGETPQSTLKREILEELGVEIEVGEKFAENTHTYGDRTIHLHCFWGHIAAGELQPIECQALQWVYPSELLAFALAPADIPIAEKLSRLDPSGKYWNCTGEPSKSK